MYSVVLRGDGAAGPGNKTCRQVTTERAQSQTAPETSLVTGQTDGEPEKRLRDEPWCVAAGGTQGGNYRTTQSET